VNSELERFKEQLSRAAEGFRFAVQRREEGIVTSVGDGVAHVRGLSSLRLEELVEIEVDGTWVQGVALDLQPDTAGVVLLADADAVEVGARTLATGEVIHVPVGEALLGRVVDPLGRPLDGLGPIQATEHWPIERPSPGIVERDTITEPLLTGLTVVDALFPIGRGQRELIIGDRGTGKSTIATDTVIHQRAQQVRCVYVMVGQQASAVVGLIDTLRRHDALDNATVVVAEADAPAGMRYIAPFAGSTMAEFFCERGEDALVVYDELSAHAVAYRELSLLLRRPPGREAYPGDIFFLHARLLERATRYVDARGGGSLTALPIIETQAGRISDFIPTNLISITDGQLYLNTEQFNRGFKPAVDVGLSVSRVGGRTQRSSMRSVAGELRLLTARYREVETLSRFGGRLEPTTEALLKRGARVLELLKQPPASPMPMGEQIALLIALNEGVFDSQALEDIQANADELRRRLRRDHSDLLQALDAGTTATEGDVAIVRGALEPTADEA
jgi:F-type H+-transporting ATPase subunit alpha